MKENTSQLRVQQKRLAEVEKGKEGGAASGSRFPPWLHLMRDRFPCLFLRSDRCRSALGCRLERECGSGLAESETSANGCERVETKSKNKICLLFLFVSDRPGQEGSHRVTVEAAAQACQARSRELPAQAFRVTLVSARGRLRLPDRGPLAGNGEAE